MRTRLTEQFGIDLPIFAFSHCRDVVAAVSRAGGMGVLGALYFTPDELETELRWIDEHCDGKPYGVDVVIPAKYEGAELGADDDLEAMLEAMIPEEHREFVERVLAEHDVPPLPPDVEGPKHLIGWTDATARPQVDVALSHDIALLANALGPMPADIATLAHEKGVAVAGLASTAYHARKQVDAGVDIIVAQGTEAGGHTGEIASMVLWPEVVDEVAPTPVLAAGGVSSGRHLAAALALGCEGVWTGSIWLTVAESDMTPPVIENLLDASSRSTVRSRALTGKPARQLRTAWTDAWERPDSPGPLPMPLQFMLSGEAMVRIARSGRKELMGMPVGQAVGAMREVRPVRDVMFRLVDEYVEAAERVERTLHDE